MQKVQQHITYHPIGTDLLKWYVVYASNERGHALAAAHCDRVGMDSVHRQRFLDLLTHLARPAPQPFDETHGYGLALTAGFFDKYFYAPGAALSSLGPAITAYSADWQDVLPDWNATSTARNRILGRFSSGIFIPADKVTTLMNDLDRDVALRAALTASFPDTQVNVLWDALQFAFNRGVGLLEATGTVVPDPEDPTAMQCFSNFANCESMTHARPAYPATSEPSPPVEEDPTRPAESWTRLVAQIGAPFRAEASLAARHARECVRAAPVAALSAAIDALHLGIRLDWREGYLLERRCRDLFDRHIGWSMADLGQRIKLQFTWKPGDADVDVGLRLFDDWLQSRFTGWRLVSVTTRGDYYLSILHPADTTSDLIGAFAECGIGARLGGGS